MKKDLEYYKKLDLKFKNEKRTFYNLTRDFAFKSVFGYNSHILKRMLISILKLDLIPNITNINLKNIEMPKDVKKEYRKNLDLLVFLSPNHTINVEINNAPFDDVKRRNVMYLAKVFSQSLNSGENHKVLKNRKFYQLNINSENSDFGEDSWYIRSTNTGKIAIDDIAFYIKNIEFYYKLYYTEHRKLDEDKLWLVLIASKNFEEMYTMASKLMSGKERDKFMEDAERLNMDAYTLTKEELDALDAIQEYDTIKNAEARGIEQGIQQERRQNKKEKVSIVKKLLTRGISIDEIIEITNLTKEEVEKISND